MLLKQFQMAGLPYINDKIHSLFLMIKGIFLSLFLLSHLKDYSN